MSKYYPQSKKILDEINKVKNILINVHRNPDLDSIGSATALSQALNKLGKKTTLICPHEIPENYKFLKDVDQIKTINFKERANIKFTPTDLMLILDSGSYEVVTGDKYTNLPEIKKIIIDHHRTNNWENYVERLLDVGASSTAEIIYRLLLDWGIEIDPEIATSLFAGISTDTVFFKYSQDAKRTFKVASELLELGANRDIIVDQAFDSSDLNLILTIGQFLAGIQKRNNYIYSILDHETFLKFGSQRGAREIVANLFARSIKGFDFGIMATEYEKDKFALSFRSKNTDVSLLAKKFGGGGHKNAAGASFDGKKEELIQQILRII